MSRGATPRQHVEIDVERCARLVTRLLDVPFATLVWVEDLAEHARVPASVLALCRTVFETKQPLAVAETAALGVPILAATGHVLGVLAAFDDASAPRSWRSEDVASLRELAASVADEIELRARVTEVERHASVLRSVLDSMGDGVLVLDASGVLSVGNPAAERLLGPLPDPWSPSWTEQAGMYLADGVTAVSREREPLARAARGTVSLGVDVVVRSARHPEGERRLSIDAHPVRGSDGKVVAGVAVLRDTTRRRAAEAALQASEERYRLLTEHASDLVRVHTVDRRMIYVSPSSERLLGFTPDEMLGLSRKALFHDDDLDRLADRFAKAVATGQGGEPVVHRIRTKSGELRWFETSLQPVVSASTGTVSRMHSTSRDITERIEAQEALAEREDRMRRLADAAFEGIAVSHEGRFIDGNASFARLFGYRSSELIGIDADALMHPDAREHQAQADIYGFRSIGVRKDGSSFPIEVRRQSVPWGDRTVRITAVRDLTAQVASEQAMRMHGEILGNMAEGVCLARMSDSAIVYANPRFSEMFGYSAAEVTGLSIDELRADETREMGSGPRAIRVLSGSDGRARYESLNAKKDGTQIWTRATVSTMMHPDHGQVRVLVIEDVTERKSEAEALARQTGFIELLRTTANEANAASTSHDAMSACLRSVCQHFGWPIGHALTVAGELEPRVAVSASWFLASDERYVLFREATLAQTFGAGVGIPGRVLATGEPEWSDDVGADAGCVRSAEARACGLRAGVAVPMRIGSEVVGVLEFFSARVTPTDHALLAVLVDVGLQLGRVAERERARVVLERHASEVQALSLVDELTGLRNRRGFTNLAAHQLQIAARTRRGALLFFADLNGMKYINDQFGHDVGDVAIVATANVLRESFREADVIARLGGDEFVVYAPNAEPDAIVVLRERVASNVASFNARSLEPFRLSISVGVAIYDPEIPRSLDELLAEADSAMYEQKRASNMRRA